MSMADGVAPTIDLDQNYVPEVEPRRILASASWQQALRWRLGLPVLGILISLTASAPLPAAPLPRVATIAIAEQASIAVHGSDMFVLDNAEGRNRLRAFTIDGGRLLWTALVAETASDASLTFVTAGTAGGGAVMVSLDAELSAGTHTEVFDPVSGRRLWHSIDGVFAVATGGDIVTRSSAQFPAAGGVGDPSGWVFQRRGLRSGTSRWSHEVDLDCAPQIARDPRHGMADGIVETCVSGAHVAMIDVATGQVTAQHRLAADSAPPQSFVFGDAIIVMSTDSSGESLDGFQSTRLRQLWSIPDGVQPWQHAVGCGAQLCLISDFGTVQIEPHTGISTQGPPFGDHGSPQSIVMLSDRAPAGATYNRPQMVPDGQAAFVPPPVSGDAWIERVGADPATIEPLQKLSGVGVASCMRMNAYLACATGLGVLSFWRLPSMP
jgi:hypothetical protein